MKSSGDMSPQRVLRRLIKKCAIPWRFILKTFEVRMWIKQTYLGLKNSTQNPIDYNLHLDGYTVTSQI